jgi:hypothetical protein
METRTLPARNPTAREFEVPLEELRARVIAGLSRDQQHADPIFGDSSWEWSPALFQVLESGAYPTWLKVLELPGNSRDLYLDPSDPLWKSPVYRAPDDGLPFLAQFHLHFSATGPTQSSVSVTALETRVLNGQMTGMLGHGPANRYVPVEPTSIEEYVVLRRIGRILGVPSMPEVILPAH